MHNLMCAKPSQTVKSLIVSLILIMGAFLQGCGGGGTTGNATETPVITTTGGAASIDLMTSAQIVNTKGIITFTAKVMDTAGQPVRSAAVSFSASGVGNMNVASSTTDANGNASGSITSSMAGSSQLSVSIGTIMVARSLYFVDGPIQNILTVNVDGNSNGIYNETADFTVSGTSGDKIKLKLSLTNAGGAPIAKKTIDLTSSSNIAVFDNPNPVTDNSGNAYAFITFNNKLSTVYVDITATAMNNTIGTATITVPSFVVGDMTISANKFSVEIGEIVKITACLLSSSGIPVNMSNLRVNFMTVPSDNGSLQPYVFTDSIGCAVDEYKPTKQGDVVVWAYFQSLTKSSPVTVKAITQNQPLTIIPATPVVVTGYGAQIMITGGSAPYKVTNLSSAVVQLDGNAGSVDIAANGDLLNITGKMAGTGTLIVKDSLGQFLNFSVQISVATNNSPLTVFPSTSTVPVGGNVNMMISGGVIPYSVTALSPAIASVSPASVTTNGGTFMVTGIAAGTANITVRDATGTVIPVIAIITQTSTTPLTVFPSTPAISVGGQVNVMISGGIAPYSVTSLSPAIASVSPASVTTDGGTYTVTGITAGTANITVRDAAGTTIYATATITQTSIASLTAFPSTPAISVGGHVDVMISGGVAPYSAVSLSSAIASVSYGSVTADGGTFTITGIAPGTANITVRDAVGTVIPVIATITQTIVSSLSIIPVSPSVIVGNDLSIVINGGTPPYVITPNSMSLVSITPQTVNRAGGSFLVHGISAGSAGITIGDSAGMTLPITVVVSSGLTPTPLTVTPQNMNVTIGTVTMGMVTGGTPPYTVTDLSPSQATLTPSPTTIAVSGGTFSITGVAAGTATIMIQDSLFNSVVATATIR